MNSIYQQLLIEFMKGFHYPVNQVPGTVLPVVEYLHFESRTPWMKPGETPGHLAIVLQGGARMFDYDADTGEEVTSRAIAPNEAIGYLDYFLEQQPVSEHIEVFNGTVLALVPHAEFGRLCADDKAFGRFMGRLLAKELGMARERERNLKRKPVQQRLKLLYKRFAKVGIYLDNDEIGSKVGISSKSVERFRKQEGASGQVSP